MLRRFHLSALSRLSAALVALALTGAPALAAAAAPRPVHRCLCPRGAGHDCAHCHPTGPAASAGDDALPPCHRATAGKAQRERRAGETPARLGHSCGDPETRLGWTPTPEPFLLPGDSPAHLIAPCGAVVAGGDSPRLDGPAPAKPPPRSAHA